MTTNNQWTPADSIALVNEYLGYEVQALGDIIVCIDGNGKTRRLPDMTTPDGWVMDCLDTAMRREWHMESSMWEKAGGVKEVRVYLQGREGQDVCGIGRTLHEAAARALRAAVGR